MRGHNQGNGNFADAFRSQHYTEFFTLHEWPAFGLATHSWLEVFRHLQVLQTILVSGVTSICVFPPSKVHVHDGPGRAVKFCGRKGNTQSLLRVPSFILCSPNITPPAKRKAVNLQNSDCCGLAANHASATHRVILSSVPLPVKWTE